jgi:hypothetical protein
MFVGIGLGELVSIIPDFALAKSASRAPLLAFCKNAEVIPELGIIISCDTFSFLTQISG